MVDLKIEKLVQERKSGPAKKAMRELLKKSFSSENLIAVISWLRRLSQFRYGLSLIIENEERLRFFPAATQKFIHFAKLEFFSSIGAIDYALSTIENLEPTTAEEYEITAGVLLSAYEYSRALKHLQNALDAYPDKTERRALLNYLSIADCYIKDKKFTEAIKIAKFVVNNSPDNLLLAISWQAQGQYLAECGQIKNAYTCLNKSKKLFPKKDSTYDYALLLRWLGFVYGKMGQKKLSRKYFIESIDIIREAKLRDDVWIENYFLMQVVGVISLKERTILEIYPGLKNRFGKLRSEKRDVIGHKGATIVIIPNADEYKIKSKRYLGIPMEIKLLALLRLADKWGIEIEKIKFLLWPHDINSYPYLEQRFFLLVNRLKNKYHVKIIVKKRRVSIKGQYIKKISLDTKSDVPTFLFKKKQFAAQELSSYYHIKKSTRNNYINMWVKNKIIQPEGKGRATKYKVL